MTAISLAPGLTEVTVFGGAPHYNPDQVQIIAATTILTFSESICVLLVCTKKVW